MTKPSTGKELTLIWSDFSIWAHLRWYSRWAPRRCSRQAISIIKAFSPLSASAAARFCWPVTTLSPEALPAGTVAFPYAPYSQIFPRAAAIVHSGGMGTSAQALAAGRPMLVVPFAFDQPDNAARLQRLGVARAIPRRHYTARRAYSELQPLLTDPTYAESAAGVARRIAEEDGVRAACDAIANHMLARR